jgi:hypothetical protein
MRKCLIGLISTALLVASSSASFAKDKSNQDAENDYTFSFPGGIFFPFMLVTYDGPIIPRAQSAVLVVGQRGNTEIYSIDGKMVATFYPLLSRVIQLTAGKHIIGVRYHDTVAISTNAIEINVDSEGGHTYITHVTGNPKITFTHGVQGSWDATIKDITSELNERENRDLDKCFKSGQRINRLSVWLARYEKASEERIP